VTRVGIVGVGLIGASFGLALRQAGFDGPIAGVSSARSIAEALERGAIDRGMTLEEAAESCDLLFLSQPICGIIETLRKLGPLVRPGTLVTDAGSTKKAIADAAKESLPEGTFLGGHPMAGKELRGAAAADADLFRGRTWVLTEDIEHPIREWIAAFGAREIILAAGEHDRLVAWSSHLPQLASTVLAAVLNDRAPDAAKVAGPGLLDSTRLALSSFDLWRDILDTNRAEVSTALDAYIEKLQTLRSNFEKEFAKGSNFSRSLRSQG
jgi:prephenate dehydrogenase